jgi:hypothetical protein
MATVEKMVNYNLLQESVILDTKIYIKLSGILLNEILDYKIDNTKIFFSNISEKIKTDFNSTAEKEVNESINNDNKKMNEIIKIFHEVNKERLALRDTLVKLIKKQFWKTIQNKDNENFFVNKFRGIDINVMKNRIEKLEKLCEEKDNEIKIRDKMLEQYQKENCQHLDTIRKQSSYLKDSILNNSGSLSQSITENVINTNTSINNDNTSVHSVFSRTHRKIKRKGSNMSMDLDQEKPKEIKESLFKNERNIQTTRYRNDDNNSMNVKNFKTDSFYESSDEDNELNFRKKNDKEVKNRRRFPIMNKEFKN